MWEEIKQKKLKLLFAGKQHPEITGVLWSHDWNLYSPDLAPCSSVPLKLKHHCFDTLEQMLQRETVDFTHSLKITAAIKADQRCTRRRS